MSRNLYQEADELERAGRFDEAVERWREASVVTPDAYTLARLGRLYLRHGQVETGESLLREVITRFPNVAGAYFYLGNHYMAQGKLADAKVLLEHSVDLEEWAPALISLGSLYWRLRDTEAARRVLRRATVADPEDSEAWSNLAMTYAREDDDRARELFERAVALDAENVFAWQELGSLCWHHGDFETAEEHVRRALALDDHSAWAHDYLGLILEATHRIHEAAQEFRRATGRYQVTVEARRAMTNLSGAGSNTAREPILVVSDDVDLFPSVLDAERYLEAPDVGAGLSVLDATGRPLRAVIVRKFHSVVVRLEEDPEAQPSVPALRAGLIRLIAGREGIAKSSVADLPLDELFARARPHMTR